VTKKAVIIALINFNPIKNLNKKLPFFYLIETYRKSIAENKKTA
jgi:hypothetical protein